MDVRIGMLHNPKELTLDLGEVDREKVRAEVDGALSGPVSVLWLTDKDGRSVGVSTDRIAYVELGSADPHRAIGFGPDR
ncbi:MAG: DUF3107 domain-containing protein [Acidimicrobiales bacterium]